MYQSNVNWLIDTGASPNVLDFKMYDQIPLYIKPALHQASADLRAADGSLLNVYGETVISVKIGSCSFEICVVVADLGGDIDGILGMRFLSDQACVIDTCTGSLKMKNIEVRLQRQESSHCCRVRVAYNVTINPDCEQVFRVKADLKRCKEQFDVGIIQSTTSFVEDTGLLISNAVVNVNSSELLVTCMNLNDEPVKLQKGITVALLSPVQQVIELTENQSDEYEEMQLENLPYHLQDMAKTASEYLTESQSRKMYGMISRNAEVFVGADGKLGLNTSVKHSINTGNAPPVKMRAYKTAVSQKKLIEEELEKMLEAQVIEPSESPWSSPVVLVTKKDGSPRFCVDYRKLNSVTVRDCWPLPNINDCLDSLSGACWFSTMDLASGYWQCEIDEADRSKTAFVTHKGLFQFNVLPMGLTNAPATFERLMERVLQGLQWEKCLLYLDDIVAFGGDFDQAMQNLQSVFSRLLEANLKLKPRKCMLFQKQVSFLGHVVDAEGVQCDPKKIEAVKCWDIPTNVTEVRSFLGFANYYRRFIKSFAQIASPLTNLTHKGKVFIWSKECQDAFDCLIGKLVQAPVLSYPSRDETDLFILDTDASDIGLGAVLSQKQNGVERVIAFGSKTLSKSQRRYCTTYKELLAVVFFVKQYRHYLLGRRFLVRTDHSSLRWLLNFKDSEGLIGRWLMSLQNFNFEIEHRKGVLHTNADGLSRKISKARKRCGHTACPDCPGGVMPEQALESVNVLTRGKSVKQCDASVQTDSDCHLSNVLPSVNSDGIPEVIREEPLDTEPEVEQLIEEEVVPPGGNFLSNWIDSWSPEQLRVLQAKDATIGRVLAWKQEGHACPSRNELLAEGFQVKELCGQWKVLEVHDGILLRRWTPKNTGNEQLQLVAPQILKDEIFNQVHTVRAGGHLGVKRTLAKIRQRFFWPHCKSDFDWWCRECSTCAQVKPGPGYRAPLQ